MKCSLIICFSWKSGVASSLNYIKLDDEKSPILHPYPSWEANTLPESDDAATETPTRRRRDVNEILAKNNQTIISTFRLRADECDRLWVMDSGLADILGAPKQWAPNSIAVFDLNTDKLIRRFVIPADQVKDDSFFANIVSDIHRLKVVNHKLCNLYFFFFVQFRLSTPFHRTAMEHLLTCQIWAHMLLSSMTSKTIALIV
jgi:Major royal jelly protein